MDLVPIEARVLGCLLEKELATPQYYPLTLNALTAACNQTSNRDPVTSYAESDIAGALSSLREKGVVRVVHSPSNRATKYRHVLEEVWGLDDAHRSVLAVLLLRGPQTIGELRARTERLAPFASLHDVEEVVRLLGDREEPLARIMARQPGQKEARVAHLLGDPPAAGPDSGLPGQGQGQGHGPAPAAVMGGSGLADRVSALEADMAELRAVVDQLRTLIE
jgi:uncharacterized protein